MVSEAHCMSFPCTELLLFNYAKVKTVFHSMAPLNVTMTQDLVFKKPFSKRYIWKKGDRLIIKVVLCSDQYGISTIS